MFDKVSSWHLQEKSRMNSGKSSKSSFHHVQIGVRVVASPPMIESCSMACSSFFVQGRLGAICRKNTGRGQPSTTGSANGATPKSSSDSGPNASITTNRSTGSSGNGKVETARMCGRRWGGKENGSNPTDRAKPGMKDQVL